MCFWLTQNTWNILFWKIQIRAGLAVRHMAEATVFVAAWFSAICVLMIEEQFSFSLASWPICSLKVKIDLCDQPICLPRKAGYMYSPFFLPQLVHFSLPEWQWLTFVIKFSWTHQWLIIIMDKNVQNSTFDFSQIHFQLWDLLVPLSTRHKSCVLFDIFPLVVLFFQVFWNIPDRTGNCPCLSGSWEVPTRCLSI